ncbi:MAG: SAM-dependent chlorinase/fluorinase [Bacteroidia bacterium]|nr:SAM-dependent chlorinase/fluorinase [Bacteroidia bacterium]
MEKISWMVITLTTDLGTRDHYAASLKGTLLTMLPGAVVVDITHEIAHFNLLEAAFVAKSACFKFPKGSVHIIGIDPEGGARLGVVAMEQEGHFFVAPDNGVLSLIREGSAAEWVFVNVEHLPLSIHGRSFLVQNRLAPVAAALAGGALLESLGTSGEIKEYRWGEPSFTENSLRGVILHIDHFGNAITNVRKDPFMEIKGDKSFQIFIRNLRMQRIVGSYADVAKGEALALFSDNGHLEIAIREGSAAQLLGLKVQDMITIEFYG